jgi:serine/threonine protein kinase
VIDNSTLDRVARGRCLASENMLNLRSSVGQSVRVGIGSDPRYNLEMSTDPEPSSDRLVGMTIGRYLVTRLLGEGGMGAVYEATDHDLGRRVAIKTLHPRHARSSDLRQRFLREGRAASRVRHPNVADIYDVGRGDDPYLVMEFLEGEDLGRLIAREAPLSVERTADLLVPVVAAVAAAHDLGIDPRSRARS